MLVLPTKKADAYDTTKPLSAFLQKEYASELDKYKDSVTSFQNVRNNAVFVNGSSGQLGFHNILRYNYHMNSISKRLSGYESEIKFSFTWVDAFQPSKRIQTGSLHHDWACVLWNMAALESSRGAHVDRSTNEGVKTASIHFQQAAGVFALLKTSVVPQIKGVKSQELNENFLSLLLDLNLAQAQICFYEKAVRDRKAGIMKPGLVAKLAKQVAKFYEQAVAFTRDKEVSRCLDPNWISHMEFQRECFQGAAEYWQAVAVKEDALAAGKGFGEEIVRLTRAEEIFTRTLALGKSKRVHAASVSTAETFLDTVKRLKFTAAKDNATIYHDMVPESGSVPEVTPIAMVKPSALPAYPTNPNVTAEPPLFADILPKEVRSLLTHYRELVSSAVSQAESTATNATNAGRASLAAIGLPGSLEVYKSGGTFPSNLWKKIQHVQMRGGGGGRLAEDLAAKVEDLERLADRARATIDGIEYSLRREETIDKSFRERYPNYSVPPSSELNQDIRRNVELMLHAHEVAKSNDQTMTSRVNGREFAEFLQLLSMSLPELEAQLPRDSSASESARPDSQVNTSELEAYLVQIATLFETRETALVHLKAHARDHELVATEAFCDAAQGPALSPEATEEILNTQLKALEPLTNAVTDTLAKQQQLLDAVIKANDAFNTARSNDPLQRDRERVIKQLEQGISAYSQSLSQITAGSTFYMDMQSRLTNLMQQCDDLSYTQQLQRQEFEVVSMREHDRESQVESDHDMALRLAEEMDRMNMPPSSTAGGSSITAPPPQQQKQQDQQYGYPQLQQQQSSQQYQQHLQQQRPPPPPSNMGVAYGQPISGPPAGATQQPSKPPKPQQFQQQQQQQQQEQQQRSTVPPSQPYASHFQAPTPTFQQEPSSSSYVYNAGFGGGGGGGGAMSSMPQNQQYNPGYQPPQQQQQQQQPQQQQHPHQQYQQYLQQPPQQHAQAPPAQTQTHGQARAQPPDENKVARLMEMGFPRDSVVAYLAANNNDEEAALNGLLSGTALPPAGAGNGNSNQPPPSSSTPESSSGGFFSSFWGS